MISMNYTDAMLKELPGDERLILLMALHEADAKFYNSCVDIIVERNKGQRLKDMSENDQLRIREMKANFENAIHTYTILKSLYEVEYGRIEKVKNDIESIAERLANHALETYDWISE